MIVELCAALFFPAAREGLKRYKKIGSLIPVLPSEVEMIYDVNSPLFKQFLSEKLMRKSTGKDKDKSAGAAKGQTSGKDRAMAHPASVGC